MDPGYCGSDRYRRAAKQSSLLVQVTDYVAQLVLLGEKGLNQTASRLFCAMSPQRGAPDNDGELISPHSFVELMSLQRLEDTFVSHPDSTEPEKIERFRSLAIPYNPGQGTRSFGGHVYAQSAYAASKTVSQGLVIHVRFCTSIFPKENNQTDHTGRI